MSNCVSDGEFCSAMIYLKLTDSHRWSQPAKLEVANDGSISMVRTESLAGPGNSFETAARDDSVDRVEDALLRSLAAAVVCAFLRYSTVANDPRVPAWIALAALVAAGFWNLVIMGMMTGKQKSAGKAQGSRWE